jgi:hypothetical protein
MRSSTQGRALAFPRKSALTVMRFCVSVPVLKDPQRTTVTAATGSGVLPLARAPLDVSG